ncbi:MFS general substrate transporter [Cantharellus anzutake]|uniref:MFS general substrate transporter n=1 Tax=Cantharellus anzutake TaxID=1750568 RepID=UPI0019058FE0|nr:MFS general substrate transporter [Cantharellus anzutake]KAF8321422.1 MFS general substrate transporter [Cantharellus anzutake]
MDKPDSDIGAEYETKSELRQIRPNGRPTEVETDHVTARRVRTKIDLIVLSTISLIWNAAKAGLLKDLKMTSYQFSVVLSIFFVPYMTVEMVSNFLVRKIGAHIFVTGLILAWGIVETFQGFVTSYEGLIVCRVFLGLTEGPLIPAAVLYLSEWYKRHELQQRMAVLFSATSLAGAFSGLLAFAIIHLDGKGGKPGWRHLDFLPGRYCHHHHRSCRLLWLPKDIASARFLTEKEKAVALARLEEDMTLNEAGEEFRFSSVWSALRAPHVLILSTSCFYVGYLIFGLAYFLPTVVGSLGYSPAKTQLYGVPPFACGFVVSLAAALFSDKYHCRGLVAIGASFLALGGFIMMYKSINVHVRYGSLFAQTIGVSVLTPCTVTWVPNNVMPHYRRATAIALVFIAGSAGGLLATWMYHDAPHFYKTTRVNIGLTVAYILQCAVGIAYLHYQNLQKAKERAMHQNIPDEDSEAKRALGDKHRDFIYTL